MNWGRFFLNLGAAAAGGFATVLGAASQGGAITKTTLIPAIVMPVIANVVGLFQQPPHQG